MEAVVKVTNYNRPPTPPLSTQTSRIVHPSEKK